MLYVALDSIINVIAFICCYLRKKKKLEMLNIALTIL